MTLQLPKDLLDRGFKLIIRAPDRMFAVSPRWGCTLPAARIGDVVRSARRLVAYLEWREKQRPPPDPASNRFPYTETE